ncbi:ATP-binding cassette domain-containing protein [Carnobacterium maltaromaticum]|uniref:ATP-binding cassette domain-containing protein n=1 Tax=Carnobacterium maltaromaticum TaxID=2751 RepID=UPI001F1FBB0A|nr:ABC transporter ATP-binding protein [Carnobacterium maltaromaticum]
MKVNKFFLKFINRGTLVLVFIFGIGYAFNGVVISSIVKHAGTISEKTPLNQIVIFGVISIVAWIVVYICDYFYEQNINKIIYKINLAIKALFLNSNFFKNSVSGNSANIISTINNDIKLLESNYLRVIFDLFQNVLLFTISLLYMIIINPLVSILFISFSFLPVIVPKLFNKKLEIATDIWSLQNKKFINTIRDMFNGKHSILTYNAGKYFSGKMEVELDGVESSYQKMNNLSLKAQLMSSTLSGISFILPFIVGCVVIVKGFDLTVAELLAIFLANDRVVGPLRAVVTDITTLSTTKIIREKIFSLVIKELNQTNLVNEKLKKTDELKVNIEEFAINDKIIFENTTFSIKKGEKILIVGSSASGKSTLLKIIQNYIPLNKGNIESMDYSFSYIEQNPYIFDETIEFNLTLGEEIEQEKLMDILTKVGLVEELGGKILSYNCGEDGRNLSGGQKQRIEVARAIIRESSIVLVDEATSALDKLNSDKIRDILFSSDSGIVEVAHHVSVKEKERYSKIYEIKNRKINLIS